MNKRKRKKRMEKIKGKKGKRKGGGEKSKKGTWLLFLYLMRPPVYI